jgi:hypothetical protein
LGLLPQQVGVEAPDCRNGCHQGRATVVATAPGAFAGIGRPELQAQEAESWSIVISEAL